MISSDLHKMKLIADPLAYNFCCLVSLKECKLLTLIRGHLILFWITSWDTPVASSEMKQVEESIHRAPSFSAK